MFFTIAPFPDVRLPNCTQLGDLFFSYDHGWTSQGQSWYKGYNVSDNVSCWTRIDCSDGKISIDHDKSRAYPLWWDPDNKVLSNLLGQGEIIWADKKCFIVDETLQTNSVDLHGKIDDTVISMDQALDLIKDRLISNVRQISENMSDPFKLFVSGGVDTLTIYSAVRNSRIDCEILTAEHFEYDAWLDRSINAIAKKHWAYSQMHHWTESTAFFTGTPGDEYFMRGPATLSIWAAWHDLDVCSIMEKSTDGYHVGYFQLPKNIKIFQHAWQQRHEIQEKYTKKELIRHILDMNANDHQHWHLNNTLTVMPLKDDYFTRTILKLDINDLVDHIRDARINKQLIKMLWPSALTMLSAVKNHNTRENLYFLYRELNQ